MSQGADPLVIWLVLPRSGSEFLVHLTRTLYPDRLMPQSSLTPGRREKALPSSILPASESGAAFARHARAGRPQDYFTSHGARSAKIEIPFADDLADRLADAFPACRFLASIRSFQLMADSHAALSWGLPAGRLLEAYRRHAERIARFATKSDVLFVDIERQVPFEADTFAAFLDRPKTQPFLDFVAAWPPVNTRAYRIERDGARSPDAPGEGGRQGVAPGAGEEAARALRDFARDNNARQARRLGLAVV
jgi:hypothetical protein